MRKGSKASEETKKKLSAAKKGKKRKPFTEEQKINGRLQRRGRRRR